MSKRTTTSVSLTQELAEKFETVCQLLHITKSDFLRACIKSLTDNYDRETFLKTLGFKKKEVWTKK